MSPPACAKCLSEIIEPDDPRTNSPDMREAKIKEIKGLLERGTFKIVLEEELRDGVNILTARFFFTLESTEDGKVKYKAQYVVAGHRDKLKHLMVHTQVHLCYFSR